MREFNADIYSYEALKADKTSVIKRIQKDYRQVVAQIIS